MCHAVRTVGVVALTIAGPQQSVTIRAGLLLDGKGGMQRNAVVTIDGARIVSRSNSRKLLIEGIPDSESIAPGCVAYTPRSPRGCW